MLERFTDEAVRVICRSRDHACELGHRQVGTEHLLLALLESDDAVVARAFALHNVTLRQARARVCAVVTPERPSRPSHLDFSASAMRALEWSTLESGTEPETRVAPVDVLLGIIHVDSTAVAVLTELGARPDRIYRELKDAPDSLPPDPLPYPRDAERVLEEMLAIDVGLATMAVDVLIALWVDDQAELEKQLGVFVASVYGTSHEDLIVLLAPVIDVDDAASGKVRLRPRPNPSAPAPEPSGWRRRLRRDRGSGS